MLVVAVSRSLPVTVSHFGRNTLASEASGETVRATAVHHLFDINITYLLAAVLLVGALTHALAASKLRRRYESDLGIGMNRLRWLGVATGGSLGLVALALVVGVSDLAVLVGLLGLGVAAAALGHIFERARLQGGPGRAIGWAVKFTSVVPWVVIGLSVGGAAAWSSAVPSYVYGVFGLGLVATAAMSAVLYLKSKGKGPWTDAVTAERAYMVAALVATSGLVWLTFAGMLRP